jgi:hypothetical protein
MTKDLRSASNSAPSIIRASGRQKIRDLKARHNEEDSIRTAPLQMLEDMGDFLASFFGVVDGHVLALFGSDR